MRHQNTVIKLNRAKTERVALIKNLIKSMIKYEKVDTTETRSKVLKIYFDRLLNQVKSGDINATRKAFAVVRNRELTEKLVNDIAKRYLDRSSGFLKVYKLDNRKGDNAKMVRVELVKS